MHEDHVGSDEPIQTSPPAWPGENYGEIKQGQRITSWSELIAAHEALSEEVRLRANHIAKLIREVELRRNHGTADFEDEDTLAGSCPQHLSWWQRSTWQDAMVIVSLCSVLILGLTI